MSEIGEEQSENIGGHWEQRPDFSFDSTVKSLGIPKENWDNPIVREFVGLLNNVKQLQRDLTVASTKHNMVLNTDREHNTEIQGMEPSLTTRHGSSELLLAA